MDQICSLVRTVLRILGTDEGAGDAAFDWMDEADGQGPAPQRLLTVATWWNSCSRSSVRSTAPIADA